MRSFFRTVGRRLRAAYAALAAAWPLRRGNGVTLWDEIAPPSPLPVPGDAPQTAQQNADADSGGDTEVVCEATPPATGFSA